MGQFFLLGNTVLVDIHALTAFQISEMIIELYDVLK